MQCTFCQKPLAKSTSKFCSNQCQKDKEYEAYIVDWKLGNKTGSRGISTGNFSGHIIRYMFEKYNNKCAGCGWCLINPYTGRSPLEIDHIDGNSENNNENNLTLLCPNCHALTKTYKNANKGNGRLWRKQKYMLQ